MKDFFCFVHIEKCAGTTLHHSIKYNLPGYLILKPWYYWSNEEGNFLNKSELKWLKIFYPILCGIGGHTTRTYARYEEVVNKDIKYFTFLRNPITRYLSQYNHHVNKKRRNWSIEDFTNDRRFDNYMTQRLANGADLELAKFRLRENFSFVGLFEEFDESLVMLEQFVFGDNIALNYEHKNDSKKEKKIKYNELNENIKKSILKNNSLDIELYKYVCDELYPKYKSNYRGDIELSTKSFKLKNENYRFNRFRYHIIRSSRFLTDNVLQKVIHKTLKK
ncbi:sulfotransferase family 2 domain-containing protein [Winogradskyella sp.]|uniref:sulfotransferase family 2 domain-containing protein n=1 Tax=Winogradskyella sp. TaxID=1883156 RepID=UPI002602B03D|nr:sulfotransferase family 2 domain-containing protein [Winogradskyella sp.]